MYKKTRLRNGVRIVSHNMKDRDSVAIGILVGVGGRYEDDSKKGVSHFIEHIVFKGSRKYKCGQIKELIEGVGGTLNAYTSEEHTCFYAKIPSKHLNQTFDILSDMVLHPKISSKDVAKEKTVIIEEIKMYKDIPQYHVNELIDELLWPDHPLGKSLAGYPEIIARMTNGDLKKIHNKYYNSSNIVISACGNIKHDKLVSLAKNKFDVSPEGLKNNFQSANNTQMQPRIKFVKKDIEQMHVAFGTIGMDKHHKDRYALSVLSTILGGNMSSRLFVEIREKRGLAYSISCSSKNLDDTGAFLIRAGVENTKLVDSIKVILEQLERIKEKGVKKDEFTRGKDYLLGQLLLGLEDTMDHMLWIGDFVLSKDKTKTVQNIIKEFSKINLNDIKRVAKEILDRNRYNLTVIGPLKDKQEKQLKTLIFK